MLSTEVLSNENQTCRGGEDVTCIRERFYNRWDRKMITEYKLEDAGREMLITVKRSSRKTLGLEVQENGKYLQGFQQSCQTEV